MSRGLSSLTPGSLEVHLYISDLDPGSMLQEQHRYCKHQPNTSLETSGCLEFHPTKDFHPGGGWREGREDVGEEASPIPFVSETVFRETVLLFECELVLAFGFS